MYNNVQQEIILIKNDVLNEVNIAKHDKILICELHELNIKYYLEINEYKVDHN